jgi:hypothetical protein
MSKKKKIKEREPWEVAAAGRKTWPEGFSPVTRVIPDKRHKKPKHKNKEEDV